MPKQKETCTLKNRISYQVARVVAVFALIGGSVAEAQVSVESLLREMVNRDSIASFPKQDFRLKQQSSYNRVSKTPDEPKGWFNNKDFNTNEKDKNFIRVEENDGQKEWVLMDHEGAGAIVRTWMPFRNASSPNTDLQIKIYLDGASEPAMEGNMLGLFNGTGLIPFPLAHKSLRSAVSFFPIPYAKSCKVVTTGQPFFYQFTFREYAAGTPVKTFTMADFNAARSLTKTVGETLLHPPGSDHENTYSFTETVAPKQEKTLELQAGSPAAVREIAVNLGSYEDPSVTRSMVLKMEFDGKETVWCPIGDFFGSGIGLHPFQGWYRTVSEDGTMSCRWVMPYQTAGKVTLVNLSDDPVDAEMKVTTSDWAWDDSSLYFHAAFRGKYPVPTRPYSDWNYVTLKGRGVYVGDTLTVMNPVTRWWGEGDEKIWVDGEDFPSIFGTGTEDYYAYSWGGVSADFYEHPFHAQPRCNVYNKLNRKKSGGKDTQGYSTETRSRSLDTMPFGSALQLDMEVWSWTDCEMGYGVGMYWYGDAATTSNRKPDPTEALNVPPLPDMGNPVTKEMGAQSAGKGIFKNAIECQDMQVLSKSGSIELRSQDLNRFKGVWNAKNHLFFRGAKVGDVVELMIPASSPVAEKLALFATRSADFGILKLTVNGQPAVTDLDLYSAAPTSSGPIQLGDFETMDGVYVLRVEVTGKNPESKGAFFGIDCVTLSDVQ